MPQPNKGDRDAMTVRPHLEIGAIVRQRAKEHHLSVTDYVSTLLAEHVGRPDLAPAPAHQQKEELPLTG